MLIQIAFSEKAFPNNQGQYVKSQVINPRERGRGRREGERGREGGRERGKEKGREGEGARESTFEHIKTQPGFGNNLVRPTGKRGI